MKTLIMTLPFYTARSLRRVILIGLLFGLTGSLGCGGGSNLPKPRAAADDEEEEDPSSHVTVDQLAAMKRPGAKPGQPATAPTSVPSTGDEKPAATEDVAANTADKTGTMPAAGKSSDSKPPASSGKPAAPVQPTETDDQSPVAQRQRTVERLEKISQALEKYRDRNGVYPAARVVSPTSGAISWRVQILPQLGLGELYARYSFQEPWDGPNNSKLLAAIPEVYQSPSRPDQNTNFLMLTGPGTAYANPVAPLEDDAVPDGLRSTILVAEVADNHAVPWTQPEDYEFNKTKAQHDFFSLQGDCGFVLFGNALGTRRIAANIADADLSALITPNGREKIDVGKITQRPTVELDTALIETLKANPLVRFAPGSESTVAKSKIKAEDGAASAAGGQGDDDGTQAGETKDAASKDPAGRWPVPTEAELQEASQLVRDLFAPDYEKAKKTNDKSKRQELVRKMIEESEKLGSDRAGIYVILRAAKEIALKLHDFDSAIDAANRLVARFAVDEVALKTELLEQAVPNIKESGDYQRLYTESLAVGDQALAADDFNRSRVLYRFAMLAARQLETAPAGTTSKDGDGPRRTSISPTPTKSNTQDERERVVAGRENRLRDTRQAYGRLADHLHTLQRSPSDATANAAVGRYFCLIKRDWELGLPKLALGNDASLKKLAETELSKPAAPPEQVALADAWWDWSEKATVDLERDVARLRAVSVYREAVPKLEPGLVKSKVEKRIAQSALLEKDFEGVKR